MLTGQFAVYNTGKENGNHYNRLCRDYYKDPFLQSGLTEGKFKIHKLLSTNEK